MKTRYATIRTFLPALALTLVLGGCDIFGSGGSDPGTLRLHLGHTAGQTPVALNESVHTSPAGHDYTVTLVEYLVTDIALRTVDGTLVSLADAHYCNDDDSATHTLTALDVPSGEYTAIAFTFGVPAAENVFGNLERSTDYDNMMWPKMMPMGDGTTDRYHYMRLEGRYDVDGFFRIHTGPSGGNDYSFRVELPATIGIDGNTVSVDLLMDVNEWLQHPNVWDFDDYGMIMGNPNAQALLKANGASVFSIGNVSEQ